MEIAISRGVRTSRQRRVASPFQGVLEPRASVMECGCPFCRFGSQPTTDQEKRQKRQAHSKSFAISRYFRTSRQRHGVRLSLLPLFLGIWISGFIWKLDVGIWN